MSRVLAGDTSCFTTLVERYQRVLFHLALRTVGDYDDAQDITQIAFVKAYRSLRSFDPSHRFFSWIYRITLNQALNTRSRRRPQESVPESMASNAPSVVEVMERQERHAELCEAIDELPEHYQHVIVLRHFSEQSYDEIAENLGIPAKTVKSRLFTARKKLAAHLRAIQKRQAEGGRSR